MNTRRFVNHVGLSVFGLILFLSSAPAWAGNEPPLDMDTKTRIQRIRYGCQHVRVQEDLRRNVPYSRAQEVNNAIGMIKSCLSTSKWELDRIRAKDHPQVLALISDLKKYAAHLKELEAVAHEHETVWKPRAALRDRFFEKFKPEHKLLINYDYYAFLDENQKGAPYGTQKELNEAREALKRIHVGCTGEFKDVVNDDSENISYPHRTAQRMCKAAAMADEIIRRVVVANARYVVDVTVKGFKDQLAALGEDDGRLKLINKTYFYHPEKLKQFVAEKYAVDLKFVGVEVDSELFQKLFTELEAARAALMAEIPKQLPRWKGGQHGTRGKDSFVEKAYKAAHKGIKIKLFENRDKAWVVMLNPLGKPRLRKKRGGVVFQLPGEAWCHDEEWAYFQDYQGGKGYGKSYFEFPPKDLETTRIVGCP